MRGHITKRGKESYSIKVSLGKDNVTGKYRYQWLTVRGSKKDAEKRLAEVLYQLDTGAYIQAGKVTVAEYLDRWLNEYAKTNLSPRTAEGYEKIIEGCFKPAIGGVILTSLRPEHLQKIYSQELKKGLSPQTVRHHHTMMHKALRDGVEWGLLARNVADAVKPPRVQRVEMQTWDEYEVNCFLDAVKNSQY